MQITEYFLHWQEKKSRKMNILPLRMSHRFYQFPFCFADISAEEISACIGWSLGLTVRETEVQLEASVSSSDCAKKGFLKTGMMAGQVPVDASCIASFGHLGQEIQVGAHKGTKKGALVPSPTVGPKRLWIQVSRSTDCS